MVAAKDMIPDDLRGFLAVDANLSLRWDCPYPVELEEARFFGLEELSLSNFELYTYEYYLNHGEPGKDPELCYDAEST